MRKNLQLFSGRKYWKIIIDIAAIFLGFVVALAIRFEFYIPSKYLKGFLVASPFIVGLFLLLNALVRVYAGRWKYASFDELINLVSAAIISTSLLFTADMLIPGARNYFPISIAVMGGVLSLFVMAFVRLQYRLLGEMRMRRGARGGKQVLLVGAGEAGEMVARDMLRHPEHDYSPVAFVDDDPVKRKLVIQGVPVLGGREDIPKLAERHDIDEIFITIPSATGEKLRDILPYCEKTGAKIKILPGIFRAMAGEVGLSSVRELKLEDLLGREPVETNLASISAYITDKVVMVTGAGGSIGSELSRQLCGLGAKQLLLLDNDETSLYEIEMDLMRRLSPCPLTTLVADIRDKERLAAIFNRYHPQVIFHSAALKHVPMMEFHPSEAVKNNVQGTRNMAEAAVRHNIERFILVSTDKAVHPVNVMGSTKRIAEMLIKGYEGGGGTLFTAVRFGNVLGSRGSVVPTFQKQIEQGGPILVTHPEVTRFFMTIEEAAELVIQAGAFTKGGDIFILDMGEPVRIIDLAREMARLMGREHDIEIRVVGLRPGEKLHEELTFPMEELARTPHPMINKVSHELEMPEDFGAQVDLLVGAAARDDEDEIRQLLSKLVPTYEASVLGQQVGEAEESKEVGEGEKPGLRIVKEEGSS